MDEGDELRNSHLVTAFQKWCHLMKVILALQNTHHFRYLGEVVQGLCANGHQVKIIIDQDSRTKANTSDRALCACLQENDKAEVEFINRSAHEGTRIHGRIGDWLSYVNYFRSQHPAPDLAERWRKYVHLPRIARHISRRTWGKKILGSWLVRRSLKWFQRLIPVDPVISEKIAHYKPDVVIATPFIYEQNSVEVECIRAASHLGIPTIVSVMSWDHLTTKGTFHRMPNMTYVWNQVLVKEAVELHDVPEDKVFATGALPFDFWFDMKSTMSRAEFCKRVGLDVHKPYVLYLGSSAAIAKDENVFGQSFADTMSQQLGSDRIQIVVRPHPLNASLWQNFSADNVTIWPRAGEWPDSTTTKNDYFNVLFYSAAVVGVNTSAFLDAAILDKPCMTIITEHFRHTQTGRPHFAHLLRGDFIEVANSMSEAATLIAAVINGRDLKAENRRRFVREFIRPYGLEVAASDTFVRAVEMVAKKMKTEQMNKIMSGVS